MSRVRKYSTFSASFAGSQLVNTILYILRAVTDCVPLLQNQFKRKATCHLAEVLYQAERRSEQWILSFSCLLNLNQSQRK